MHQRETPRRGRAVILNGPSSAGKTSIARALQDLLPRPMFYVALDNYISMLPKRYFGNDTAPDDISAQGFRWVAAHDERGPLYHIEIGPLGHRTILDGMHPAIVALSDAGQDVVVDDLFLDARWLDDYLERLAGRDAWLVRVECPLSVLEQRERDRGDRTVGQARGQHELVYAATAGIADVVIDTSKMTPEESAARIADALSSKPSAFDRLRHLRSVRPN